MCCGGYGGRCGVGVGVGVGGMSHERVREPQTRTHRRARRGERYREEIDGHTARQAGVDVGAEAEMGVKGDTRHEREVK